MTPQEEPKPKNKISLSIDSRILSITFLLVIIFMLISWHPWNVKSKSTDRTVQVTGNATIKSEPDEYVFNPYYEFQNANKQAAIDAMSKKSDEIVAQLKKLGVADKDIKTNANGYKNGVYYPELDRGTSTYTLNITITASSKELAQKVQDYLVTTAPTGSVSPYAQFSEAKQKELQGQARNKAEKDARAKAEQSAKNLHYKLGDVKSIKENNGFDVAPYAMSGSSAAAEDNAKSTQLAVQPGENDLSYQISVTYFIK
jgi:uncharacterized protein YggE